MVFAFAGGAEDDDVVPVVLLAESEGLVEVVGVLFGDVLEALCELLAEFGGERVAVADDDGGCESGVEAGDGGAVAADEVCGVAEDGEGEVVGGEVAVGEDDGEVIGGVGVGLGELEVRHGRVRSGVMTAAAGGQRMVTAGGWVVLLRKARMSASLRF